MAERRLPRQLPAAGAHLLRGGGDRRAAVPALGLSAVIGYLFAGVVIGPAGFSLIDDPGTAASVGGARVVLLLFIVGLELKLSGSCPCAATSSGSASPSSGLTALLLARPRWRPASRRRRPW
jgi:hypothetical protein